MTQKPIIDLRYTMGNEPGLIVLCSSGVNYANQTGGHCCLSPVEEGVYLPLFDDFHDQGAVLTTYFTDIKIYTSGTVGLNKADADAIDSIFDAGEYTKHLKVDRERLQDSHEAWLYVAVHYDSEIKDFNFTGEVSTKEEIERVMSPMYGFNGSKGVLTWINSD